MKIINIENIPKENITGFLFSERQKIQQQLQNTEDTIFEEAYTFENILCKNICEWLIFETEKFANENGGWQTKRHRNYPTTDLPVRIISNIHTYLNNFVMFNIFPLIEQKFNLDSYFLNIEDLFIVKYEFDKQNYLEKHRDGNLISFNILLNEKTNFEGGGTIIYYRNNNNYFYEGAQGSLLLHSGQKLHEGSKITSGIRYLLVGFISYLKLNAIKNN